MGWTWAAAQKDNLKEIHLRIKKKGGTAMFRTFFNGVVNARLDELSLMERELKRSRSQERK